MSHRIADIGASVTIIVPDGVTDLCPLCATLDGNNCLTACGGTANTNVQEFLSVHGDIAYGPSANGQTSGQTWRISGLGPITPGNTYCLTVTATIQFKDGTPPGSGTAHRYFIAVRAGYYSCPSGHFPSPYATCPEISAEGTLPRYYRVRLSDEIPGLTPPRAGLLLGGLLAPANVYLVYDLASSVSGAPVWRDVNLPEFIGRWTLRVAASRRGESAELVQQTIGPREVVTEMVFRCQDWNQRGVNRFLLAEASGRPARDAALSLFVEPV